jgi:RNA binding exosome subunit
MGDQMGFLTDEAREQMEAFLDGEIPDADVQQESEPEVEASSEPAEDVNQEAGVEAQSEEPEEAQAEPSQEASSEPDGTEDTEEEASGHRVPYSRFKQMVEARNALRVEASEMKARLEALEEQAKIAQQVRSVLPQQQPVQQAQQQEDPGLFGELLADLEGQQQPEQAADPRVDALMERVQQQEVAIARRELEVEVASAMEAYPGVPRQVLLQAVVADPDAAVIKVAESYSTHLAQIEEAAIARYLEENPAPAVETQEVAEKPKAAPRPTRSGAADSDVATGEFKPKSIKEGSDALRKAWGSLNPFS